MNDRAATTSVSQTPFSTTSRADGNGAAMTPASRIPHGLPSPRQRFFSKPWRQPRLNLALQGGGSHGAFTWGVLDALLAESNIDFEGLSGSSAGAMNAVALAHGWAHGGREGARAALAEFWTTVGQQLPPGIARQVGDDAGLSAAGKFLTDWASHFSPAQLNPFDLNPLRELLKRQIDFERLRSASKLKLFIGATEANSGKLRVFREHELTVDVLLASACLPKIHHPIEIDGTLYWDGGYSANPAVFPLFYDCDCADILLVLLSPLQREETPRTVEEIEARIAEIGFSAHFMREMRTFAQASNFARPGLLQRGRLEKRLAAMRFHMVDSSGLPSLERTDTKQLAYAPFLDRLKIQGQERARQWLAEHGDGVGSRSTVDMARWFS